jgi:hypothetical protein
MVFLDFCAAVMRNRHLARPWLKVMARGCEIAQTDQDWARTCSSYFGGLEVRPPAILGEVWLRSIADALLAWQRLLSGASNAGSSDHALSAADLLQWQTAVAQSMVSDPRWHMRWTLDVQRRWARVLQTAARGARDRRAEGLLAG